MKRRREPPNCSFQRTRIPTPHFPSATGAPLISSLGSWGKMLTKSQDKVAMIKPEQRTISTRGRASRYALIELPRKPSAANDKASLTTGSTGPACHRFDYPSATSGPLNRGVRLAGNYLNNSNDMKRLNTRANKIIVAMRYYHKATNSNWGPRNLRHTYYQAKSAERGQRQSVPNMPVRPDAHSTTSVEAGTTARSLNRGVRPSMFTCKILNFELP